MSSSEFKVTQTLDGSVLSRLERMRLQPQYNCSNRGRGEHISKQSGTSTEFADFRNYIAGDDIRNIDWNIFSRLQKPFVKLYRNEEEMHLVILIDASESMDFNGKLERAKQIATAFCVMGLWGNEKVSIWVFNSKEDKLACKSPSRGRGKFAELSSFISEIEVGGDQSIDGGIDECLKLHRGRGMAILISDFMTFGDTKRSFNSLFANGLETFAIQILSQSERDPEFNGDVRLVDAESQERLDVSASGNIIEMYYEYLDRQERELETLCQQRAGHFISVTAEDSIFDILFEQIQRKGWFR